MDPFALHSGILRQYLYAFGRFPLPQGPCIHQQPSVGIKVAASDHAQDLIFAVHVYGRGQLGLGLMANLVGQLQYFYTDKVGLAVGSVGVVMVIAKVVEVHIDDDVLTPDGKIDFLKIKPLGRMGYWDYTYVNDVFSMAIPGLTAAQMSGMGGDRLKKD